MKERLANWLSSNVEIAPKWATSKGKILVYMFVPGMPLLGMAYGLQKNWFPTLVFCLAGILAIMIPQGAALAAALWLSAGEGVLLAALLGRRQEPNLSLFYLIVQGVLTIPFFIAIRSILQ